MNNNKKKITISVPIEDHHQIVPIEDHHQIVPIEDHHQIVPIEDHHQIVPVEDHHHMLSVQYSMNIAAVFIAYFGIKETQFHKKSP